MEIPVVTEKLESRVGEEWAFEKWGLGVRKVSRAYARENQLDDDTGVIVIGVQPGFPAAVAGLAPGDIITKINQQPLAELGDAQATSTSSLSAGPTRCWSRPCATGTSRCMF